MFALKKALFLLRLRRGWIQRPRRLLQAQPYAKAKKVAMVAHIRDHAEMLEFVDKLCQENKNVRLLVWAPKDRTQALPSLGRQSAHLSHDYFYAHQINWSGHINAAAVLKFIAKPYDVALNLSLNYNPYLEYVLKKTHAALKIGFDDPRRSGDYHCLLRGTPGRFKNRADFLYHYLSKL